MFSLKPAWYNFFRSITWLTLSNAFFISRNIPKTLLLEYKLSCKTLLNKNRASLVDLSGKNPNWFLEKNSFLFRNINILLLMHFSNILDVDNDSATGQKLLQSKGSPDLNIGTTTNFLKQEGNTLCEIDKLKIYDKG